MPNTDPSAEPTPTHRPRAQPSLMGASDSVARAGPASDGGLRMLDQLESSTRPRPAVAQTNKRGAWMLLGLVAAAVVLAWLARTVAPAPASGAQPVAARQLAAKPVDAAPAKAVAETAAPENATARIENSAQGAVAEAVAATQVALAAPAPVATPVPPASAEPAKAAARPVARPAPVRTARTAEPPLPSPAAALATTRPAKTADADVVLLSALLAHVSRSSQATTLAEQDQLTIAQIVQRCEARGGEEARECRRRICEGYWGKAEACPAPATPAPKKG